MVFMDYRRSEPSRGASGGKGRVVLAGVIKSVGSGRTLIDLPIPKSIQALEGVWQVS
jgi:hypothetical protein